MKPSHAYGFAGLVVAKVGCCSALVLAATGAVNIAGLASWLAGGAYLWLAAAALALVGLYLGRHSARISENDAGERHVLSSQHGKPKQAFAKSVVNVETKCPPA